MRVNLTLAVQRLSVQFPFLFGGAFIEGTDEDRTRAIDAFPFLFGGAFIEGTDVPINPEPEPVISLPFRRGFH